MIVAYLPLLLPLHYAMWSTQLTWSISRVRCEVTSRLLKAIAMKTLLLFPSKATRKRQKTLKFVGKHLTLGNTYHCWQCANYASDICSQGTDITSEMCSGAHICVGNIYHCNTVIHSARYGSTQNGNYYVGHRPPCVYHLSIPLSSVFVYCKRSNTGGWNDLGTRLSLMR